MEAFKKNHADEAPLESILARGELKDVLPELIQRYEIDLLVLGSHGRHGIDKLILGSTAEQIFRVASCAVLMIGPTATPHAAHSQTLNRILFATDFSPTSLHALRYALSLAEENEAGVVLLHEMKQFPFEQERQMLEAKTLAHLTKSLGPARRLPLV